MVKHQRRPSSRREDARLRLLSMVGGGCPASLNLRHSACRRPAKVEGLTDPS
jgi:hypothetical protein